MLNLPVHGLGTQWLGQAHVSMVTDPEARKGGVNPEFGFTLGI